jgi:catechol 2,3-dioxygenase-like lactoylglutathione lyase family enzyme
MQLDAIGIVVTDLAPAVAFYRLLGLPFPDAAPGEDHLEATTPSGLRVMLDREEMVRGFVEDWVEPRGQRIGMAFRCASPAEVDATYARVVAAGFRGAKAPWDAFWGQRYAQVADPDGNRVDLFAQLPAA